MTEQMNYVIEAEAAFHKTMIKAHSELLVKLERIKQGTYAETKAEPQPLPEIITSIFEVGQSFILDGLEYLITEPGRTYSVAAARVRDENGNQQLRYIEIQNSEAKKLIAAAGVPDAK